MKPKLAAAAAVMLLIFFASGAWAAGSEPIDFSLPALDGGMLRLSDFRGRVVLVEFFDSSCRVCKRTMPKLQEMANRYRDSGLSVIGYSVDKKGAMKVRPFVAKLGVSFPIGLGDVVRARHLDPIEGLPTILVVGPRGRVVQRFLGYTTSERLLASVQPYLSTSAPPPPMLAKGHNHRPGMRRITNVWIYNNQMVMGQRGVVLSVEADLADLEPLLGLWLALHIRPEASAGSASHRMLAPKVLYHRVDDVARKNQVMFIRCDQFGPESVNGAYRAWVTVLDSKRQPLDRSSDFVLHPPACISARN